ncbi:hypothetical protein [Intestinibacillus massiliensis]|uniref:hypothetical protein n=1 Tax=Intestinibacillus massiliensis TaxID=1871029 RepID=UPI000B357F2F|nr:hypothetical protein [Intestinibacillus massiliensis]
MKKKVLITATIALSVLVAVQLIYFIYLGSFMLSADSASAVLISLPQGIYKNPIVWFIVSLALLACVIYHLKKCKKVK